MSGIRNLFEVEHCRGQIVVPLILALGATPLRLPVPMHDGLQDGGEGRHADACADQDGVLRPEDVARRSAEWTVDVDLER